MICTLALIGTVIELIRGPAERDWRVHLILTGKAAGRPIVLASLGLVLLPYDTLICLDAILRSGLRMLFTRRGLLLWQLPAYARRNARHTLVDYFAEMWIAPLDELDPEAVRVEMYANGVNGGSPGFFAGYSRYSPHHAAQLDSIRAADETDRKCTGDHRDRCR